MKKFMMREKVGFVFFIMRHQTSVDEECRDEKTNKIFNRLYISMVERKMDESS